MNYRELYAWWEDVVSNISEMVVLDHISKLNYVTQADFDYVRLTLDDYTSRIEISIRHGDAYYDMTTTSPVDDKIRESFNDGIEFETRGLMDILKNNDSALKFLSDMTKVWDL